MSNLFNGVYIRLASLANMDTYQLVEEREYKIITTIYNMDIFQKMLLLEIPVSSTGNVAELNFRLSVPTVFVNVSLDIYSSIDSATQVIETYNSNRQSVHQLNGNHWDGTLLISCEMKRVFLSKNHL